MMRNVLKFSAKALAIVLIAAGIIQLVQYIRYRGSTEYQMRREVENLKKQYAEDPYGGDTPEETLRLFTDALKKGDTELAAKYFVMDKQEEFRQDLAEIKEKGLLEEMVRDLETASRGQDLSPDNSQFSLVNDDNEIISIISIIRKYGSKWKIQDF